MLTYGRKREPATQQGTCTVAGCTKLQRKAPDKRGKPQFRALCRMHYQIAYDPNRNVDRKSYSYRRHKKTYCEECGPETTYHFCQLDVHHVDGDHTNDHDSNLQTLCANCHRLVSYNERHGIYRYR